MDIKSLKNNLIDSINSTSSLSGAVKKIRWLYNKSNSYKTLIDFRYPDPIGKISLQVRDNNGSDSFIISEVFQHECYYVQLNSDILNVLDLGANAGFTAVYFSRLFSGSTIACVEPMPGNLSILKENLALNKVNAIVFETAAAIADGQIVMETGNKDYGHKVQNIPFGVNMNNDTEVVNGLSINTILRKLKWEKVDLLKIDIEGYEGILLTQNNEWLAKVGSIIMEIHEGVNIDAIKDITDTYGFIYKKFQKGNWVLSKKEIF